MNLRSGVAVGRGVLPKEGRAHFEEGVDVILGKWTALQLAVDQEWGGRNSKHKAEDMVNDILDWFYRKKGAHLSDYFSAQYFLHDAKDWSGAALLLDMVSLSAQARQNSPGLTGS
jgi:Pre-rRNA-processing protein TSR2